jgi:hypothetical protein
VTSSLPQRKRPRPRGSAGGFFAVRLQYCIAVSCLRALGTQDTQYCIAFLCAPSAQTTVLHLLSDFSYA